MWRFIGLAVMVHWRGCGDLLVGMWWFIGGVLWFIGGDVVVYWWG